MTLSRLLSAAGLALVCACQTSDEPTEGRAGAVPPLPESCKTLPTFATVEKRALETEAQVLAKRAAVRIEAAAAGAFTRYATSEEVLPGGSVDQGSKLELARLIDDPEQVRSVLSPVPDLRTHSLLAHVIHPETTAYSYALAGDTLLVLARKTEPCLDTSRSGLLATGGASSTMTLLLVPKAQRVEVLRVVDERYYAPLPVADGSCRRIEEPAFLGAGDAGVDPKGEALLVNGFSALTGNIFTGKSNDGGTTFSPNGWSQEGFARFDDRGEQADVESPYLDRHGDLFRLTVRQSDLWHPNSFQVVEYLSKDITRWGTGRVLLRGDFRAPARTGDEELLVESHGTIARVATLRDGEPQAEGKAVLGPSPGTYYDHSVSDPDFKAIGGRRLLWFTARSGGRSALFSSIGIADEQPDGTYKPRKAPILVPQDSNEAGGVGQPTVIDKGSEVWLYYTAINARNEPTVRRAVCPP